MIRFASPTTSQPPSMIKAALLITLQFPIHLTPPPTLTALHMFPLLKDITPSGQRHLRRLPFQKSGRTNSLLNSSPLRGKRRFIWLPCPTPCTLNLPLTSLLPLFYLDTLT